MEKYLFIAIALLAFGCSETADETAEVDSRLLDELPIGDTNEPGTGKGDDFRHNGEDDFSETCKPIPEVEPLNDPEIVISVKGRTVRLFDNDGDYNEVFSVGLGKIEDGTSLTPTSEDSEDGVFYVRGDWTQITDSESSDNRRWAWNYSCRIWSGSTYYNPRSDASEYRSYFAGLPFLRLQGSPRAVYGLHGPIDNYWRENGGELYRGYVSGGCSRMQPDDLLELAGRIRGHKTKVTVQQEIEFDEDGLSVDSDRFAGAHCFEDSDCADEGALCVNDPNSDYNFCTVPCDESSACPIRENEIVGSIGVWSYCVADTNDLVPTSGYCAVEGNNKTNFSCKSYPSEFEKVRLPLVDNPDVTRSVCAVP